MAIKINRKEIPYGSIGKRNEKRGYYSWDYRRRHDGKVLRKHGNCMSVDGCKEALREANQWGDSIVSGKSTLTTASSAPTLKEFCERIIANKSSTRSGGDISPTTKDGYRRSISTWVNPIIGNVPIDKLSRKALRPVVTAMVEKHDKAKARRRNGERVGKQQGCGRSAMLGVRNALSWCLAYAVNEELIDFNYASVMFDKLDLPKRAAIPTHNFVSIKNFKRVVSHLRERGHWLADPLEFGRMIGARQSEIQGMQWPHFDLAKCKWVPGGKLWRVKGETMSGDLKNENSAVALDLEPREIDFLRNLKRTSTSFLFVDADGKPLDQFKIADAVREELDALGIVNEDGSAASFRSMVRRGWATDARAAGLSIEEIEIKLRNKMGGRYAKDSRSEEELEKVSEQNRERWRKVADHQSKSA